MPAVPSPAAGDAAGWLDALEAQAQRHDVHIGAGRVAWRRFGDGAPLVLLHGGHGRWTHWARNVREWATRFTVWVPDLPGYGDSDLPAEDSMAGLVGMTLASLDALVPREQPLDLVGFSFGSLVALQLAGLRGGVGRVALLGPAGHGGPRRPRGDPRPWRGLGLAPQALRETMHHNLAMHMLHAEDRVDDLALRIHTEACERTRFNSKKFSRQGGLPGLLAAYSGPLLLAWGVHDVTAYPAEAAALLSQGRTACRTHLVADAGHWVQYEQAQAVNSLVLSWLTAPAP